MKREISVILSVAMITLLIGALVGCGADIKAENEKLKAENTSLKSDHDKLKLEVQKLKEEIQKAADKDAQISALTAESEALKTGRRPQGQLTKAEEKINFPFNQERKALPSGFPFLSVLSHGKSCTRKST
jgi:cell division protein FtsB